MPNFTEALGSVLKARNKSEDPVRELEFEDLLGQLGEMSSIMRPYLGVNSEAYKSPVGRKKDALELELKRRYEEGLLNPEQEKSVRTLGYVSWEKKQK